MHIGNLRTALYAYLIARHHGGQFILRIEDTDRKRHVPAAVQVIYDSLRTAGLDYDEGPDKDGGYGPYVQSERLDIYRRHAEQLVAQGDAYRCFCARATSAEAGAEGDEVAPDAATPNSTAPEEQRPLRDVCRSLSPAEAAQRARAGEAHAIRQRIPDEGSTTFYDLIFGAITIDNDQLDDQVLLKSDGYPTYNFANVVDDHLMAITHVVRGVEYLSSTPKYNLLYASFGWDLPEYVHTSHIVKESGKKWSKRDGDASFQDLLALGYLPEAVINYVALLGWNPGTEREFFPLDDLVSEFDIGRMGKSSAAFSFAKLDWLNGEHVRTLTPAEFAARARPFYPPLIADRYDTDKISRLIQPRVTRLTDIPDLTVFFGAPLDYPLDLYEHPKSRSTLASSRLVLSDAYPLLRDLPEWTHEALAQRLVAFGQDAGLKTGAVMWPIRIALSGQEATPGGATEIAEILGRDESLRRIAAAGERLAQG
jgi:glutamyl-tRNA synthetase